MKIDKAKIFLFSLPLAEKLTSGPASKFRDGLFLRIQSGNSYGWGEASPLPGLSKEDITLAHRDLQKVCSTLPASIEEISKQKLCTSAACAMSMAYFDLTSRSGRQRPVVRDKKIFINALVSNLTENPKTLVRRLVKAGFKSVKIKIGRSAKEAGFINNFYSASENKIKIRLDGNCRYSLKELTEFDKKIKNVPLDFYEDPFKKYSDIRKFYESTGRRIALDENVNSDNLTGDLMRDEIAAVVIKPMTYTGGLSFIASASAAEKSNKRIILSSSYESILALSFYARLAAFLPETDHGFDTETFFKNDIFGNKTSQKSFIKIHQAQLTAEKLERLSKKW